MTLRTHGEFCEFLQDFSQRRTLDLMPRSTFKTSIGTIGLAIWYLLNNPDHYILISNQTATNAQRMLREIEAHLDGSNPLMAWLFPEFIKPYERYEPWSRTEMTIPCRTVISGTPSITAFGVGAKAESQHFHFIITDDLIGEQALESPSVMADAIAWHDYIVTLFVDPSKGFERMHGTRWGLSDLYSEIIADPEFKVFQRKAVLDNGELFFPERVTWEFLRQTRERNYLVYMSQYMNDPHNPEALDFNIEWLNFFLLKHDEAHGPYCELNGEKFYVKDMDVRLVVDPAASGDIDTNATELLKRGRAKKANNAVEVWGLHGSGYYFMLDLWVGRGRGENPELQVATEMLNMFQRWRGYVRKGYVESYGAQRGLITIFNMLCVQQGLAFPMEEVGKEIRKAKHVRIRSYIGPMAQNKLICVRRIHDQFIDEFTTFPQSTLFDTLDAAAWAVCVLKKPESAVEAQETLVEQVRARRRLSGLSYAGY